MKLSSPIGPSASSRSLFIVVAFGSAGDVHPMAAIGRALLARRHRVVLVASAVFEPLVRQLGLEFEPLGTVQDFEDVASDPRVWHPLHGLAAMAPGVEEANRLAYAVIARIAAGAAGTPVRLIATTLAFAARSAAEKLHIPLATVHLSPSVFFSAVDPPATPGGRIATWLPLAWRQGLWWLIERGFIDRRFAPGVNRLRRELALPPVTRVLGRWIHSPDIVIGLFPRWFAPPRTDWPANLRLTGFPLFDAGVLGGLPRPLEDFLAAGNAPIVFTAGTAMGLSADFFARAVEVCRRMNRRGVLLTRYVDQLPELPEFVHHERYVPLGQLLPRAAAIVHHGGVGTAAQALRAGVPQLVLPFGFDQFDNAARLRALGVADSLPQRAGAVRIARHLGALLASTEVALACRFASERMPAPAAVMDSTCKLVESLR